ncbi:membrane-associated Zn-dependent protease 1 [Xenorhabdus kozodoii]|uniref:Membrane-associated Zn-dependent protease 1 n=1 Tax=Xenorhabdus kozodoii TaxID=351676 RepID=A0A2D0LFC2_9GAMM|nr:membrane-associated Zn-dependent protease 1 [Xenorhabdus kozodoii]PHM74414.1 membrane-associated Zn-dependent protease 1 [Xenorhabdus kozodoii]
MKWRGYLYSAIFMVNGLFTSALWAKGEAHLLFHMGLGANGKFFVGGTLQNKGDQPVAGGYLAVLPLNAKCEPGALTVHGFEPLAPGEKREFRVPINAPLSSYRLMGFGAYDDMGFPLPAIDETAKIIHEREPRERKACQAARKSSPVDHPAIQKP